MRSTTRQESGHRLRPIAIVGMVGALIAVIGYRTTPPDPFAHGKRLSEWLRVYRSHSAGSSESPERRAADQAIRALGPKAIPLLLQELQLDEGGPTLWFDRLLLRARLPARASSSGPERKAAASRAFLALGPAASNAVPALLGIRERTRSIDSHVGATYALAWIGPLAGAATPMLRRDATSANPRVRAGAVYALGEIHAEASVDVPLLIDSLTSSNEWVQACAAHALGNFGASAGSALSTLSALTNRVASLNFDRDEEARAEALNAISRIEGAEQQVADPLSAFPHQ